MANRKVKNNRVDKGGIKGGVRTPNSGRTKGTPNKRTQELIDLIAEKYPNYNPIFCMIEIGRSEDVAIDTRLQAHKEVAQYIYPKRKAIEYKVADTIFEEANKNLLNIVDLIKNPAINRKIEDVQ